MLPYWRLSSYYFFYFAFIGAFSPYFGLYLQSLAFSAWDIGLLMSLLQMMRLIAPYAWGWLADHLGTRTPIVRLTALLSIVAFAGLFFTRDFAGVFFAMAGLAFFWGAALPLVESVTLSHLGAARTADYGRIRLWGSIGFICAVLGVGYLLDWLPLASLLWMCLAILVALLASSTLVPEALPEVQVGAAPALRDMLGRREVRALFGACFCMSAAHGALYVFYSILLVDAGYSKSLVGWMWTLGVLAEILVFARLPQLFGRWSLRVVLLVSFGCAIVRFLMIGWGVAWLPLVIVAQLLHGATFGAYHAASVAAVNRWFTGRLQARGQALYSAISFGAGGMVGGLVSGYTWDALGAALTYSLSAAFAAVGLLLVWRGWAASAERAAVR
jgi:PPP family 3-phenylpropionic acid transporter